MHCLCHKFGDLACRPPVIAKKGGNIAFHRLRLEAGRDCIQGGNLRGFLL